MKNNNLLIPYVTAGFPTKKLFVPILKTLSEYRVDFIEIGVPYSDPLADGPIIQESSKTALENGITLKWIVEACCSIPLEQKIKPLILFSYFNPILKYGLEKLLKDLPRPLFYGLMIPDLPLEEANRYLPLFKKYKLNLILLCAPNTKKEKTGKIAKLSNALIYLVSVTGTTGIRKKIPKKLNRKIKEIKSFTQKPVVVGFGISNAKQARQIISYGANGIVVGSALIRVLNKHRSNSLLKVEKFIKSFRQALDSD